MTLLLTGGSGLLGTELRKLDERIVAPPHERCDVTSLDSVLAELRRSEPTVVLHAAAATRPPQHERHPEHGIDVNIGGTANVARACAELGLRMVYVSTDYVYFDAGPHSEDEPVLAPSRYTWSKLGGECAVRMIDRGLILRTSFGPVPFPWERVYRDQRNSKLYVDEAAPLILAAARTSETGVMNIGGPPMTLEAYACRSRPMIDTVPRPDWVPPDTSLDTSRMQRRLGIDDLRSILRR